MNSRKPPVKVCPVVIRKRNDTFEILAFRHPLAGTQLVKGTLEPNEDIIPAAYRELWEESGINEVTNSKYLGSCYMPAKDQFWHFILCHVAPQPNHWNHYCLDDGGHDFAFFWHPLDQAADNSWHPVFIQALSWIRQHILATEPELS
ncbi:NUDIX hydrolase [Parendozoicomonas haliclonae]|uniref:NUDIX domain protein n=1 Tax=Parendozoicomonas haliclonae TaxID=1960125 RepID=A0A1X7AEQ9_9GAMM|nr:NUDIX domain-containing protein [Parendozoicomonas haliclonae]SMA34779.1 NUDIX domain protein [Parendozoicomonas haliclonae]